MPYFAQEPLSYLTLPTIRNAYKTFNIKVNFRPDNVDGEGLSSARLSFLPCLDVDSVSSSHCCLCLSFPHV